MFELEKALYDACKDKSGFPSFQYTCSAVTKKTGLFTACIGTAKIGGGGGGGGGAAPASAAAGGARLLSLSLSLSLCRSRRRRRRTWASTSSTKLLLSDDMPGGRSVRRWRCVLELVSRRRGRLLRVRHARCIGCRPSIETDAGTEPEEQEEDMGFDLFD